MPVTKESVPKEPSKLSSNLAEAMTALIILFLMLPFAAICLKATVEVVNARCFVPGANNNGR
ncbi:hypothetical protein IQ244_20195 [Nostoc sp. LEGE 06077]|uniref:hypothetical protein n=1 Tax=Nostoc sp. LEGE 06077 TaxID=915325 RepID=UPI0018810564|nr:hypothetical protein [Nostoc sp. LEGE 06077]MBE9208820.1 hypothetical protein [Nostoc sp. LEGE 06077]